MNKEKFILSSKPIEISEFPNHKEATFLISVLDEYNSNGVLIEKAEGEKYHKTIIGYPILAYLKYDKNNKPSDFGGHELRQKYNSETKEIDYYFATSAIGSVLDAWIETREVEGYEGEKDVVLIKTKLWSSRFPSYFKVFDKLWEDGNLSSSWEISSSKSKKTAKGKKLIDFEWIGNTILGSNVEGAVKGAGVLEVAEKDNLINNELSQAFLQDIQVLNLQDSSIDVSIKDNVMNKEGGKSMAKKKVEQAALTENDLRRKINQMLNADYNDYWDNYDKEKEYVPYRYIWKHYPINHVFYAISDGGSEDEIQVFEYEVDEDDNITLKEPKIEKLSKLFAEMMPQIEPQQAQINIKLDETAKLLSQKETKISELEQELATTKKEFSEAGVAISELSKTKEELEVQVSELIPFKEKVEKMEKAENERLLSEKIEELKSFSLEDNLIAEAELEENEELKTIFSELTLENYETSQGKVELIKGRKALEKFKAEKSEQELETSSTKDVKKQAKTDLNNGDEGMLSAIDVMKSWLGK